MFSAARERGLAVMKEPRCEQFELFQSVVRPDKLTILERWKDQAALDAQLHYGGVLALRSDQAARRRRGAPDDAYNWTRCAGAIRQ